MIQRNNSVSLTRIKSSSSNLVHVFKEHVENTIGNGNTTRFATQNHPLGSVTTRLNCGAPLQSAWIGSHFTNVSNGRPCSNGSSRDCSLYTPPSILIQFPNIISIRS